MSQAAIRAGLPANRIATTVSGVEFRWRDVTIKSLPARHESTMTINEQFVADQPESFLLSTTADSRISCGGDVSISQDLKRGRSSQPNITVVERRRAPEFVPTTIVNDRPVTPPSAGLSAPVMTLGHADCGPAPDIRFVQTSDSTVRITSGASVLEVAIVAFRQEQA